MANRISAQLNEADATNVRQKITDIKALLPFLIEISKDERKKGQKIGKASVGYVRACVDAAINNPDILVRNFKVDEFRKDLALFDGLSPLDDLQEQLFQLIRDTVLMIGKDLMEQANSVYEDVKKEAKKNNSLKPLASSLGEFYKKSKSEGKAPAQPK